MNRLIRDTRRDGAQARTTARASLALLILGLAALAQAGCLLTTETPVFVNRYNAYTCRAALVNAATGEARMVASNTPSLNPVPGHEPHVFFDFDWDGNGTRNTDDALLDWRRYISSHILTSPDFAGGAWCVTPGEISCTRMGTHDVRTTAPTPTPLPSPTPAECDSATLDPRLEVTAPGLTPDHRLSFAGTPVGLVSAPVRFTVTNVSTVPLRVVTADFVGGPDSPDFEMVASTCTPTPAEMSAGLAHLLAPAAACTVDVRFRPQYRPGAGECDRDDGIDDRCRRRATFSVTSATDADRRALAPINASVSGGAVGARLFVEPAAGEVCFTTPTPSIGSCTETRMIRIGNEGARGTTGNLTVTFARLTRAGDLFTAPPPFLMGSLTLMPGEGVNVPVQFCNRSNDTTDGVFTINTSAPRAPTVNVTLVNPLNRRCP